MWNRLPATLFRTICFAAVFAVAGCGGGGGGGGDSGGGSGSSGNSGGSSSASGAGGGEPPGGGIPRFVSSPVTGATENEPYIYLITVVDDDWDMVTLTAPTVPAFLSFIDNGDGTATLLGTPDFDDLGTHPVELRATDTEGHVAGQAFNVTVSAPVLFSDDFNDGNANGWIFVDNANDASDWVPASSRLEQRATVTSPRFARDGPYQLGNYAYLGGQTGLSDYRVFVELSSLPSDPDAGAGYGLMFRYQNDDNYYRLSFSARQGHARLERKLTGEFSTLGVACLTVAASQPSLCDDGNSGIETLARAVDARGYTPGQRMALRIEVVGPLMQIFVDDSYDGTTFQGEARFAAHDSALATGSIALYAQSGTWFDNVTISGIDPSDPNIVIAGPLSYSVTAGQPVVVSAVSTHTSGSESVEFYLDGAACPETKLAPGYHSANCGVAIPGDHVVEAYLTDGGVLREDRKSLVGIGGNRLTVGDSITKGTGDLFPADNVSADGRINSTQGYQATLADLLSVPAALGVPQIVFNEGIGGSKAMDMAYETIDEILERHPNAGAVQLLVGTNDSGGSLITPSGTGCSYSDPPAGHQDDITGVPWPSDCAGTFKGFVQWTINKINAAGKVAMVARIPPAYGRFATGIPFADPVNGLRNLRVRDYNNIITNELVGHVLGPDFYDYFIGDGAHRFSLYADNTHPNSLGHMLQAYLWRNAITLDTALPLVLDDICIRTTAGQPTCESPLTYKQNLMTVGNAYFVDESYTLQSIPPALLGGVWLNTANAHRNETRADLVEITVDRPVTVYVGYDQSALVLPAWLAAFTPVSNGGAPVVVGVSDSSVNGLRLYQRSYAAGTIVLGGALATITGAGSNYVVVIKE